MNKYENSNENRPFGRSSNFVAVNPTKLAFIYLLIVNLDFDNSSKNDLLGLLDSYGRLISNSLKITMNYLTILFSR
jgi:hypothetical protein